MCVCVCVCVHREREVYSEDLAFVTGEAGKSETCREGWRLRLPGGRIPLSWRKISVFSSKTFNRLDEAHPDYGG